MEAKNNPLEQTVTNALNALEMQTGIAGEILALEMRYPGNRRIVDGRLQLTHGLGTYDFEAKRHVTPTRVGPIAAQIKALPLETPTLLVADYITPTVADQLRELDIQFLDLVGNAYLYKEDPLIHVWVIGNKPEANPQDKVATLFKAAGLRTLFPALCHPTMLKLPYRDIAEHAQVALGTVAKVMKDLIRQGYIIETTDGREFVDFDRLLDRWVENYPRELRPKLKPRRYRTKQHDWWTERNWPWFERQDAWLGGEAAAAVLTRNLRPAVVTVYGVRDFKRFAQDLQLVRDENGNLEVLETFWEGEDFGATNPAAPQRLCHPLLVYADLVATGDARNLEVAAEIRAKYLTHE